MNSEEVFQEILKELEKVNNHDINISKIKELHSKYLDSFRIKRLLVSIYINEKDNPRLTSPKREFKDFNPKLTLSSQEYWTIQHFISLFDCIGNNYIELEQYQNAIEEFKKAISILESILRFPYKDKELAGLYLKVAIAFDKIGNHMIALDNYSLSLKYDSLNVETRNPEKFTQSVHILFYRSLCYIKLNKLELALEDFNKILISDELEYNSYYIGNIDNLYEDFLEICVCFEDEIYNIVIREIDKILQTNPFFLLGYFYKGLTYFLKSLGKGNGPMQPNISNDKLLNEYIKNLKKVASYFPDFVKRYEELEIRFLANENVSEKEYYYKKALCYILESDYINTHISLLNSFSSFLNSLIQENNLELSIDSLNEFLKQNNFLIKADTFSNLKLIELDNKKLEVYFKLKHLKNNLAVLNNENKIEFIKYSNAFKSSGINNIELLNLFVDTFPKESEIWHSIAMALSNEDKFLDAIPYFNKAIEYDYSKQYFSKYCKNYCNCLIKLEKFSEALKVISELIEFEKSANSSSYHTRSEIFYLLGKYTNAIIDVNKSISLNAKNPNYYFSRAKSMIKLSYFDKDEVENDLKKVIELKPNYKLQVLELIDKENIFFESIQGKSVERSRNIPQNIRDQVWRRAEGKCEECGSNQNLEFDHIVPFSKGGSNTYRNIQLLCESCNRKKYNNIG